VFSKIQNNICITTPMWELRIWRSTCHFTLHWQQWQFVTIRSGSQRTDACSFRGAWEIDMRATAVQGWKKTRLSR